jgi:hypothetical protein
LESSKSAAAERLLGRFGKGAGAGGICAAVIGCVATGILTSTVWILVAGVEQAAAMQHKQIATDLAPEIN